MRCLGAMAAVLIWALATACGVAGDTEIVTTGVGVAAALPDYADVTLWIRASQKTATQSTETAAATYHQMVQRLEAIGIAPSDVLTQRFSVAQDWKEDDKGRPREFIGYITAHQLTIRVRDREKVGQVIDEAIAGGARSIDKIEFGSARADSAQRVALADAVRDAEERAGRVAKTSQQVARADFAFVSRRLQGQAPRHFGSPFSHTVMAYRA